MLRQLLVTGMAMAATTSCSRPVEPVHAPVSWKHVDVGSFSFYVPPDVNEVKLPGIAVDSYVREFQGTSIVFHFDYGNWSYPLNGDENPTVRWYQEYVGGKRARFVSWTDSPAAEFKWQNFVAVHFPDTGKKGMLLTMTASCDGYVSCRDVEDIFRTIRFTK
jgi:hypothetical protein